MHPGSGTAIFCPSTYFPSQDAFYADDAFTQVRGSNLCPWPGPHAVSRGSERTSWAELLHLSETRDPDKESPKVSPDKLMWPGGFQTGRLARDSRNVLRGSQDWGLVPTSLTHTLGHLDQMHLRTCPDCKNTKAMCCLLPSQATKGIPGQPGHLDPISAAPPAFIKASSSYPNLH